LVELRVDQLSERSATVSIDLLLDEQLKAR